MFTIDGPLPSEIHVDRAVHWDVRKFSQSTGITRFRSEIVRVFGEGAQDPPVGWVSRWNARRILRPGVWATCGDMGYVMPVE
jgi:hypothetical protein